MLKACHAPELLQMAARAIWLRAHVNVIFLVAHLAVITHARELTLVDMAFSAFEQVVYAAQDKVFVEIGGLVPAFFGMAG